MRLPSGDRCRSGLAALCIAAFLIIVPAQGLSAEYAVFPNGSAYFAAVQVENVDMFEFAQAGILGERIPFKAENVTLSGNCSPCSYEWSGNSLITFEEGNYTIRYQGELRENHLTASYPEPYRVQVILPQGLEVTNPLLGMVSPGAVITPQEDGSTQVEWNATRSFELRFYEPGREDLLIFFGNFWIILAIVLLLPFLLTWRRKRG